MLVFLTAAAILGSLFWLQYTRIRNYKRKRFIFYYAETICNAYQEHGDLNKALLYADVTLSRRHPKTFVNYYTDVHFMREVHIRLYKLCCDLYVIGVGRNPPYTQS